MRIVVAGRVAAAPWQGGASWAVLQYVLGFEQLGHAVLLLEPAPDDPAVTGYFERVVRCHGLVGRAAVLHQEGSPAVPLAEGEAAVADGHDAGAVGLADDEEQPRVFAFRQRPADELRLGIRTRVG